MSPPTEAITTAALTLALDAAALRQRVAAANIANANAAGHVTMRVTFESALADALAIMPTTERTGASPLSQVQPELQPARLPDGTPDTAVRLDTEIAAMAANAIQYQALSQALSRHLGLLATAAADGRR